MKYLSIDSSIGVISLTFKEDKLIRLALDENENQNDTTDLQNYFEEAIRAYLILGVPLPRVSLSLFGTEFQNKVWTEILKIPYGEQWTYQKIAENIGRPRAIRAVATAVGKNPIPLFIPCHRVVRKDNKSTGFIWGKEIKEYLLDLEKKSS